MDDVIEAFGKVAEKRIQIETTPGLLEAANQ